MAGFDNTIVFSAGERLTTSSSTDIQRMQETSDSVSRINHTGDPEGVVSANPSSLCHDSASGNIYFKQTGTGNTGWVLLSGGGGNVTITADDGNSLTANPYDIFGQKAGVVPVNSTAIVGSDLLIANNTWDTQYVVDPSTTLGLKGTFQTIQAAINQAVADGAAFGNYKVIKLRSIVYTEDLTIPGGIILVGQNLPQPTGGITTPYQSSVVIGNHTFTGNAVGAFQNVNFLCSTGDMFTGGAIVLWYCLDCLLGNQGTGSVFNITSANTFLSLTDCDLGGPGELIIFSSGSISLTDCTFSQSGVINNTSGGNIILTDCTLGALVCSGSSLNVRNCVFSSNVNNYAIGGTAAGVIQGCQFGNLIGVQSTITAQIIDCCTTNLNILYETGTTNQGTLAQQGSVIQSKNVTLAGMTPYTVRMDDHYIGVDNTLSPGSIILPDVVLRVNQGQEFMIKDVTGNASTNNIVITGNNGILIDGLASYTISSNYGAVIVKFDGTNYFVIAEGKIGGGGGGGITSLTPRNGGAISTSNIPVQGYDAGATQVIDTYNDSGTLRVADQTFPTRYVVDPSTTPGLMGTYQTINAAMTQAIADGWSITSTGVCTILIRTGSYTEDLIIPTGFAANFVGMSQSGLNTNTSDVTINGSVTHQLQSYALFRNIAINPPATDGVIIDDGIYGAFYTDCALVGGTNSALQFLGNTQPFIAEGCQILGPIQTTSSSTAGNLDNCASFYNCAVASLSNYAGAGKVRFFNCQVAQCNMSDTAGVALYNCESTGNITGSGTGDCRVYNTVFLFNGTGVSCFDHAGSVEYSNVTCTNGSTLYSTNPTRIFQPNSQGNILNKTLTATDYTVLFSDYLIAVTSTAAARTITIPDPSTITTDQSFIIKDQSGGAATNNITITPAAGLVDGVASAVININYGSVTVYSDGTNYFTI